MSENRREGLILAEGKLAFAFDGKSADIGSVYISKVFGIVGDDGSIYKFRLELKAHKGSRLTIVQVAHEVGDGITIIPDRTKQPWHHEDINDDWNSPRKLSDCVFTIYNLNGFGVTITFSAMTLLHDPHRFNYASDQVMILDPGCSARTTNAYTRFDRASDCCKKEIFGEDAIAKAKRQVGLQVSINVNRVHRDNPSGGLKLKLGRLFDDQASSDFKVTCEEETFYVHKFVLSMWSDSLAQMLNTTASTESVTGEMIITDFRPKTVEAFLRYLYTEVVRPIDVSPSLLLIANKYFVDRLFKICENYLAQFGCTSQPSVINLAIIGHQVNSKLLMQAALGKLYKCQKKNPEMAEAWAKACEQRPDLGIAISQLVVADKIPPIVSCFMSPSTSNITLIH